MEESDVQLQQKKRARRRLVGAMAFVALVAIILPMIMDHEPKPVAQDVEIRIPGQDEKPFAPKFAAAPVERPEESSERPAGRLAERPVEAPVRETLPEKLPEPAAPVAAPVPAPPPPPAARLAEPPAAELVEKPQPKAEKPAPKPEKPVEKPAEKIAEKPAEKLAEKPASREAGDVEARRAAAILAGKPVEPAAKGGESVVLIGAFTNEGNVKSIRTKLGELGIKTYTEPLDSPQGRKTRVRAGPFPSREAADKALEKMKRVGVSGVVAAKP